MTFLRRIAFMLMLATILAGCSTSNEEELRIWMNEQRTQMRPRVKPVSEPEKFVPEV